MPAPVPPGATLHSGPFVRVSCSLLRVAMRSPLPFPCVRETRFFLSVCPCLIVLPKSYSCRWVGTLSSSHPSFDSGGFSFFHVQWLRERRRRSHADVLRAVRAAGWLARAANCYML